MFKMEPPNIVNLLIIQKSNIRTSRDYITARLAFMIKSPRFRLYSDDYSGVNFRAILEYTFDCDAPYEK